MIVVDLNNITYIHILQDEKLRGLHRCLQELQLWQGENPLDSEAGIDYFSVFNRQKFLRNELSRVLDKYSSEFKSAEINKIDLMQDGEIINAEIIFTLSDNTGIKTLLNVKRSYQNGYQ